MQAKLLRVLQEGELERVGGAETIKVDVRVIAATNKNLEKEIAAARFREDLYYRLNVVQIHSPPLRERREDLPALIDAFLKEACAKNGRRPLSLSPEALAVMSAYDYPGNVRELRNLVERLAILCEGPVVAGQEAAELLPRGKGVAPQPPSVRGRRAASPCPADGPGGSLGPGARQRLPAPGGPDLPRAGGGRRAGDHPVHARPHAGQRHRGGAAAGSRARPLL